MSQHESKTSRDLLIELGITRFNATMLIETMMMPPATTAAASAPVMMLIGQIQYALNTMGANPPLRSTGLIDDETNYYVSQLCGPKWLGLPWYEVVKAVLAAKREGKRFPKRGGAVAANSMGLFDLPDVPGGMVTYALGAYALYRVLKKKRG
jgi:hypothetical protein